MKFDPPEQPDLGSETSDDVNWRRLHNSLWQIQLGLVALFIVGVVACVLLWKIYDVLDVG
jgi:hypothetical protein